MLTLNLKHVLEARGINKPLPFLAEAGIPYQTALTLVKKPVAMLRLAYIEKICRALHCTPNDLLEWKAEDNDAIAQDHPLHELKRDESARALHDILQTLPLSRLKEVQKFLEGKESSKL